MDSGRHETYLIPLLNRRALTLLGGGMLANIVAVYLLANPDHGITENEEVSDVFRYLVKGTVLGSIAVACWIATAARPPVLRYAGQAALILVGVTLYWKTFHDDPWISTLIDTMGIVSVQNLLFAWFWVPHWNDPRQSSERMRGQFSIASLIAITAAFAFLLGSARHFSPPIEPVQYWPVLFGIWGGMPVMVTLVCQAMLAPSFRYRVVRLLVVGLLAILGSFVLAWLELEFAKRGNPSGNPSDNPSASSLLLYRIHYLMVLSGYLLAFMVAGIAARASAPKSAI
ncbi:hypothetical protein Pla52o_50460 [Novipirellula galeiformis]|uniref:Uncharacterized protein n=1 Tax=Novipirellula galeiformis TaxID=2528004 RepID=A0A5C6BYS8_9BACT|nr:hypothetical protein Pla52o_50460 [Novipirellula galeiformis]